MVLILVYRNYVFLNLSEKSSNKRKKQMESKKICETVEYLK